MGYWHALEGFILTEKYVIKFITIGESWMVYIKLRFKIKIKIDNVTPDFSTICKYKRNMKIRAFSQQCDFFSDPEIKQAQYQSLHCW